MARIIDIRGFEFIYSKGMLICLEPICLDIETSNNKAEKPEDLITWISSIQVVIKDHYYLFRTPEELIEFYKALYEELDLIQEPPHLPRKIFTFIHNASYDLSYLIPYFREYLPRLEGEFEGIIEGPNKVLTYSQGALEFRCTYRLTGKSLATWLRDMHTEHQKKIGFYDYDETVYQDSKLNRLQEEYDKNDVLGMKEALIKHNAFYKDNLATMPLTSTGYIRRDLRRSCNHSRYYRNNYFYKTRLDEELYYASLKSFSGGYTHNNRFYKNITIKVGNKYKFFDEEIKVKAIGHRDFKSHYPSQMASYNYKFPVGVPQLIYDITSKLRDPISIEEILSLWPNFWTMNIIRFYDAELRDKRISMPFMQHSKCHETAFSYCHEDNGRIVRASGVWIMFLDNLTLQILNEQYKLEYDVIKVWKFKAEYLPTEIVSVVDKYFKGKSDIKNEVKSLEALYGDTDPRCWTSQFNLLHNKQMLNSIYGCCATQSVRTEYFLNEDNQYRIKKLNSTAEERQEALDKFYKKYNNFLPYQYGWAVTSLSRFELYEFIKAIGYKKILYSDTDSAFYIKDAKTEKAIERLNARKRQNARYVELDNGKKEYYDEFTPEPDCIAFKGLHSKCYGVVTEHGLKLTIAGVPDKTLVGLDEEQKPIYLTREAELMGHISDELRRKYRITYKEENDPIKALDRLEDDFKFSINTGKSACYVGAVGGINGPRKPMKVEVNGHIVSTAGGCVIKTLTEKKVHDKPYDATWEYEGICGASEATVAYELYQDVKNN